MLPKKFATFTLKKSKLIQNDKVELLMFITYFALYKVRNNLFRIYQFYMLARDSRSSNFQNVSSDLPKKTRVCGVRDSVPVIENLLRGLLT